MSSPEFAPAGPGSRDQPILRVVACGSVDDGKSTLIGRLLAATGSVPDDQLDYARRTRRGGSTIPPGEVDFSLLTDGLEAEHAQGITIDVAYRHLYLPDGRRAIIADAPGHEQYTRNMAVAASTADAAILLVDASRGLREQTFRHLTVCALLGVRTVIAAVNKLDCVDYHPEIFGEIAAGVQEACDRAGAMTLTVVPVSALQGDNVTARSGRLAWFTGPTLLEALTEARATDEAALASLRLPVQYVIRADRFRGYAGTLASGQIRPGDPVGVAGRGVSAVVRRVLVGGRDVSIATAGDAVVVSLAHDVDLSRGDLLVGPDNGDPGDASAGPARAFAAELVWTGEEPLMNGRSYLLLAGPRCEPAVVTTVRDRLDVRTGERLATRVLAMNDIGTVEVTTDSPIQLDPYLYSRHTGGFLLVDRLTGETVAAGLTRHPLRRGQNVTPHHFTVDREARGRMKGQRARVLWLTGLPGCGKSSIADALDRRLYSAGMHTYVLDGDSLRARLNRDLGFTPQDRAENVRRVAEVSRLMYDAGLVVIVALVSPFRSDRECARSLFPEGDFLEVFVDTPPEVCAARDPKHLYAKARSGTLPNLTGVGQGYEPPVSPALVLNGAEAVDRSVTALESLLLD